MHPFQREFIEYAIACEVLRFGDFTLKSGRNSPYFFNTGLFNTGARLGRLGSFYAQAFLHHQIHADILYGPAYKGIPLVSATSIALSTMTGAEIPYAFNRKEAKDHGEGGHLVGAPLHGDVLILDDVITAGTSVRESVEIITAASARPCGVLIAMNRQEKGLGDRSAVEEVEENFKVPVYSIIGLSDVLSYLEESGLERELETILAYQKRFG